MPKEADDHFAASIFKVSTGNRVHYSPEIPLTCVEDPFSLYHHSWLEPLLDRIPGSSLSLVATHALVLQYAYLNITLDKINTLRN